MNVKVFGIFWQHPSSLMHVTASFGMGSSIHQLQMRWHPVASNMK
jgi:hypothetical protein